MPGERAAIASLGLVVAGAHWMAPFLRPVLSGRVSGPLQPIAQLMLLEQSWADEGYATFAEHAIPAAPHFVGPSVFPEEVRCSHRVH
ncbi:hypothetical protein ACIREO_23075 [Streptomyces sp. NPDC102441]|uniref:hypothetical protein n=1 Tax=Streptomyces sp. NPDC102441 TaxID=3366176 RepID=UPI0037FEB307